MTAPGNLTIEVTPDEHRTLGACRLVYTASGETVVLDYDSDRVYLGCIEDYLERLRQRDPDVRVADARTLLRVLGVDVEDLR